MGIFYCFVFSELLVILVLLYGGFVLVFIFGEGDNSLRFSVFFVFNFLRLKIRDLGLVDSGEYTCLVINFFGNAFFTLDFYVNGKTVIGVSVGNFRRRFVLVFFFWEFRGFN